jgi:hypothetical protein
MTTTRIGTPFQDVLSKVKDARVVSVKKDSSNGILGQATVRELDVDGDGTVDARHTEWKHRLNGTRHALSFLDDQGRPVDTFMSGGKQGWTMRPGDPSTIFSHTHREYGPGAKERIVHETAPVGGGARCRTTTLRDGATTKSTAECDFDGNGTLEPVR